MASIRGGGSALSSHSSNNAPLSRATHLPVTGLSLPRLCFSFCLPYLFSPRPSETWSGPLSPRPLPGNTQVNPYPQLLSDPLSGQTWLNGYYRQLSSHLYLFKPTKKLLQYLQMGRFIALRNVFARCAFFFLPPLWSCRTPKTKNYNIIFITHQKNTSHFSDTWPLIYHHPWLLTLMTLSSH